MLNNSFSFPKYVTFLLLFEKTVSLIISFFLFVVLANTFDTVQFGEFTYYLAFFTFLIPFCSLGFNSLITREVLSHPKPNIVVANAFCLRFALGLCVAVGIIIYDIYFTELKYEAEFHILLLMVAFSAGQVFDFAFQAFKQNHYVIAVRLTVLFVGAAVKLYGISSDWLMPSFLLVVAAEYLFTNCALAVLFRIKQPVYSQLSFDVDTCKSLLRHGVWLYLSAIAAILYLKLDQVMLRQLVNPVEVAHYAVASKFTELFFFVPIALVTAYFPNMLETAKHDPVRYQVYLQRISTFLLYLSLVVIVVILLLNNVLVSALFPAEYIAALPIITVQIWSLLFVFQRALISKWILVEGILRFSLLSQGAGAIINIVLNLLLIPNYGGVGAAWATVGSHAVSTTLILLYSAQTRNMLRVQWQSLLWPFIQVRRYFTDKSL